MERERILKRVPTGVVQLGGLQVRVERAEVTPDEPPLVSLVLSAKEPLDTAQVDQLKALISKEVATPIKLEVQSNIRR